MNETLTEQIVELLPYKIKDKVKLIRNSKNQGLAYSLNLGIEISKGKYILRIDSDDFALKERTTIQVNFLEKNPEYDLITNVHPRSFPKGQSVELIKLDSLFWISLAISLSRFAFWFWKSNSLFCKS